MTDASTYTPSAFGRKFHALTTHEALGGGSAGPGKSLTLLMDPVSQMLGEHERTKLPKNHPHYIEPGMSVGWCLHLRRTRPMLDQTIARSHRFFPRLAPGAKWDAQHTTWTFPSGYRYQFGHCRDSNSYDIYMSNEYTHVSFDELVQFEEDQYENIASRCRTTDPVLLPQLKVRSMTNPMLRTEGDFTVKNPYWVRERFVDPAPEGGVVLTRVVRLDSGEKVERTRIYLKALLKDNPDPEFVRQYEANLRTMKPHFRRALLEADWYVVAGAYYSDIWDPNIHVCRPFKIPDEWPQFRMMDWGFKKPGCIYWAALDQDDNMYVHKEFTFRNKTATEVAMEAREIEIDLGLWSEDHNRSLITGWADTQLWEARGEKGMSKASEFSSCGMHWQMADKRSRQRNAERIAERLKDHHDGTTTPGLLFFSNCKQAIKTIPSIPADPANPECPLDGGEDHWHDAIGYGVAGVSRGRGVLPSRDRDDDDFDDEPPSPSRGKRGYGL